MPACDVQRVESRWRSATRAGWEKQYAVVKKSPNTWYVVICTPHKIRDGHDTRRSRTFASEADAKRFAATRIEQGVELSAGTLNPVVPKRVIGPSQIEAWLSEEANDSAT
jgi:hypothetical protein